MVESDSMADFEDSGDIDMNQPALLLEVKQSSRIK